MTRVSALRSRRRRWASIICGGVLGSFALLAATAVFALHALSSAPIKRRLRAAARDAGVDLDYAGARVDLLSGLEIDRLVVRSPPAMQTFAPALVRVGRVRARWSLRALLAGRIERVELTEVTLSGVVDEHGRSSFDALARDAAQGGEARGRSCALSAVTRALRPQLPRRAAKQPRAAARWAPVSYVRLNRNKQRRARRGPPIEIGRISHSVPDALTSK
jgi:hypothetical protein